MSIGIALRITNDGGHVEAARRIEASGCAAVWIRGGQLHTLELIPALVRATRSVRVGTAIIPPHVYAADQVAATFAAVEAEAPGRFVVGLGAPQQPRALATLNDYLDRLDAAVPTVPTGRRILAALGPRKLALARERFAGAITLLVTPEYTAWARDQLGPDATLVVQEMVALGSDVDRGRERARGTLRFLSGLRGYAANFARMGFADDEIADLGDRLVDGVVALGDVAAVTARVERHLAAGADHVVLSGVDPDADPQADPDAPVALAEAFADRFAGRPFEI